MKEIKEANAEEEKIDLSIIIPFAGEFPQVLFTIQATAQSLLSTGISFEILAIDNYCQELRDQWRNANARAATAIHRKVASPGIANADFFKITGDDFKLGFDMVPKCLQENQSGEAIKAAAGHNKWLRYLAYDGHLSHWECKRLACKEAKSDTFLFIDAHTIPTPGIDEMLRAYSYFRTEGSFHMPLTYKILEWRRLIYKTVIEKEFWGYSFTSFDSPDGRQPMEVDCMSTCGMMISREIYDTIGGWPEKMGAYGGGENFINYAMLACGFKKWIFSPVTLFHHGAKRDYHSTYDGTLWNRLVAHYLFGGKEFAVRLAENQKGNPAAIDHYLQNIFNTPAYQKQRALIKKNTTVDLDKWRMDKKE